MTFADTTDLPPVYLSSLLLAACTVFLRSIATVVGPTPPRRGVIQLATSSTAAADHLHPAVPVDVQVVACAPLLIDDPLDLAGRAIVGKAPPHAERAQNPPLDRYKAFPCALLFCHIEDAADEEALVAGDVRLSCIEEIQDRRG